MPILSPLAIACLAFDDLALGVLLGELDLLAGDFVDALLFGARQAERRA